MPDIIKENRKYFAAVMQAVDNLHKVETEIKDEKILFAKFADFLTKNANETGKFHAVENEIVDFLQNFSFTGNVDFTLVRDKLLPLPPIRQKLVEMGKEAKKLVDKPDRYNCYKALEVCKQLAMFCSNEMKSADYAKVTAALENNIPALLKIQQEFETEKKILSDIQTVISKNSAVLNKYAAYKAELQQFVASFPNNRDTDLKTVEQRLTVLNNINKQTEEIEKTGAQIRSYADRFNKNNVQRQAESVLSSVYAQMKFRDAGNTKSNLQQNINSLKTVIASFNKEQTDTIALHNKLKKESPDIWKNDNEQIISELDIIIKKDTRISTFSLQNFYSREQMAVDTKRKDIACVQQKYKWLRRSRYAAQIAGLKNKYMTFSDFQSEIKSIRRSRGLFTQLYETLFYS
jgi:hypothetical protein